ISVWILSASLLFVALVALGNLAPALGETRLHGILSGVVQFVGAPVFIALTASAFLANTLSTWIRYPLFLVVAFFGITGTYAAGSSDRGLFKAPAFFIFFSGSVVTGV